MHEKTLQRLRGYQGSVRELARRASLSHSVVLGIRDGRTPNPGILTMKAIQLALDQLEAEPGAETETEREEGGK